MGNFIKLHSIDNVVIALKNLEKGDVIMVNERNILLDSAVNFGHKIAIEPIKKSASVLKYGLPIGVAKNNISIGEHVHVQNLESNYFKKDEI